MSRICRSLPVTRNITQGHLIRKAKQLRALCRVVLITKQHVDLLQCDATRLRNEEIDIHRQHEVHPHEEEQALQPGLLQKQREELLENGVCDVLHLRAHADGLSAHVHREDLGCPDPGCGAPGRLVKEDEEEEAEDNGDAYRLTLCATRAVGRDQADYGDGKHGDGHADGSDKEQPSPAEPVCSPDGIEREDDAKGCV